MLKCNSPSGKPVYIEPKTVAAIEYRDDGTACVMLTGGGSVVITNADADKLTKNK